MSDNPAYRTPETGRTPSPEPECQHCSDTLRDASGTWVHSEDGSMWCGQNTKAEPLVAKSGLPVVACWHGDAASFLHCMSCNPNGYGLDCDKGCPNRTMSDNDQERPHG
jgi:hypothetical protein